MTTIYATVADVEAAFRTLGPDEVEKCEKLLEEAGILIDTYNSEAADNAKRLVSCHIVRRMLGEGSEGGYTVPIGTSQGSIAAGGYSQSWTYGSNGGAGEMYLTRTDKKLLGVANRIGARSPVEDLAYV